MSIDSSGHLHQRREVLLVSEEHQLFLLTGQPLPNNSRHAYIDALPFSALTAEGIALLKSQAEPLTEKNRVTITREGGGSIRFEDGLTGTRNSVVLSSLGPEKERWKKLLDPKALAAASFHTAEIEFHKAKEDLLKTKQILSQKKEALQKAKADVKAAETPKPSR
jgi:hypothetical protein